MSFGADYPAPKRSAQDPPIRPRGRFPQVLVWASVVYAAYLTVESLAGAGFDTGVTGVIGSVSLLLVLVPSNLLRFRWWSSRRVLQRPLRFLSRLRKPLGISAGVWFVAHTIVGFVEFFDFSSLGSFVRQTPIGDVAVGLLATLIFVALLATSTDAAQRRPATGSSCSASCGSPSRCRWHTWSSPAPGSGTSNRRAPSSSP